MNDIYAIRLRKKGVQAFIVLAVAGIALSVVYVPLFWTSGNFFNVLTQASSTGILAIGLSFTLVGAGFDVSLPSVMAASAVTGAIVMKDTQNIFLGIIVMLGVSLLFGALNGIACAIFKLTPFIVTLATSALAQGIAVLVSRSKSVAGLPDAYLYGITGSLFGIPVPILCLTVVTVMSFLILNRSAFGRKIFAVGINEKSAEICGINVVGTRFLTYILSSLSAGFVAVILTARLMSAAPSMATDLLNMDVISSAILGGVSIYGGKGTALGAVLGSIFIIAIGNVMNLLSVTHYTQLIIKGIVIVIVIWIDSIRGKESVKS